MLDRALRSNARYVLLLVLSIAAVQTAIEYEYRFTEYRFAEYEEVEIRCDARAKTLTPEFVGDYQGPRTG